MGALVVQPRVLPPHPYIPDHGLLKSHDGFSVLEGPYATCFGRFEIMDPEGEVHGFLTIHECRQFIYAWRNQ